MSARSGSAASAPRSGSAASASRSGSTASAARSGSAVASAAASAAAPDYTRALQRAALRREQPLGAVGAPAVGAECSVEITCSAETGLPQLEPEGLADELATRTGSTIALLAEPTEAGQWKGAECTSGSGPMHGADGRTRYVEVTAALCAEGSLMVCIGRALPNPPPEEDEDGEEGSAAAAHEDEEDEDAGLVDLRSAEPATPFVMALGAVIVRGEMWPKGGCDMAAVHSQPQGETLGLLFDTRGGTAAITMYRHGRPIGRRAQADPAVPSALVWSVELLRRGDVARLTSKPFPTPRANGYPLPAAAPEMAAPSTWWPAAQHPPSSVRSSLDAHNRTRSQPPAAASADPAASRTRTRVVGTHTLTLPAEDGAGAGAVPFPVPKVNPDWPDLVPGCSVHGSAGATAPYGPTGATEKYGEKGNPVIARYSAAVQETKWNNDQELW